MTWKALILIVFGSFLLAACSTAATPTPETSTAPPPATTDNFAPTSPPADTPPPSDGTGSADLVAQGQAIFIGKGTCLFCPTIEGISMGLIGPDLTHVATRHHLVAGILNNTDGSGNINESALQNNIRNWITDPEEIKPGNIMSRDAAVYNDGRKANLNEQQISALVAYLMSLK